MVGAEPRLLPLSAPGLRSVDCGVSARARCGGAMRRWGVGYGHRARTLLSAVSSRPSLALLFACAGAYMRPPTGFGLCAYTRGVWLPFPAALGGGIVVVGPGTVQARRASSPRSFPCDGRPRGALPFPIRATVWGAIPGSEVFFNVSCCRLPLPGPRRCVNALKLSQMDRISAYLKTDRITAYVGTAHARRACRGGLAVCPSLFSPFVARSLC